MRHERVDTADTGIASISHARRTVPGHRGWLVAGALAGAATLSLAACGSSGSSSSSSKPKSSSSTPAPATPAAVKTSTNSKFGTILVDTSGKTVYTLTNGANAVPCTGQCLNFWPPVIAPAGSSGVTVAGVSGLATVAATAGQQVTHMGLPLYTFAKDQAAGDATGDGVNSFGGTWHVVKIGSTSGMSGATGAPGASPSGGGAATTTPTTKASGGYGY
jgi:predicted lipoprotein with Yx(FWY)xxD motif